MCMSVETMETDESFVSINLDSQECELCHQDNGETLVSCHFCLGPDAVKLVKEGFNRIIHVDTKAHSACFARSHHEVTNTAYACRSVVSDKMCSDPQLSFYSQIDKIPTEHIKEVISGKIQKLVGSPVKSRFVKDMYNSSNNELKVQSMPCTRTSSPIVSPRTSPSHAPHHRRNSHHSQQTEKKYEESMSTLQDSYIRYLFGGKIPSEWKQNKENRLNKDQRSENGSCVTMDTNDAKNPTFGNAFKVKSDQPDDRTVLSNNNTGTEHKPHSHTKQQSKDDVSLKDNHCSDENHDINVSTRDDQLRIQDVSSSVGKQLSFQIYSAKQLEMYPVDDILEIISGMKTKVEGISSQLVNILEERDSLRHEISVRHATIEKLLKIKQQTVQEKQVLV